MSCTQKRFELTALTAALMVVFSPAMAADEELELIGKLASSVSVGVGYWNDDRPQMGIFDGMRDDGAYLLLDADINKRDDDTGTWKKLMIRNLGTDAREVKGEYLQQGNWGVSLEYNQTPREAPYTVNTTLIGLGTEEQVVGANIAGPPSALTGTNVQLGTERQKYGLGFYKNLNFLMPGFSFKANYTHENKEGNRHWGRGGAAEFAVEPIDYTTHQFEAIFDYTSKLLQLSGGYIGSWFENANDLVCSRTAAQTCGAAGPYYLSLPFDNQAHQVYLSGSYQFTPTTNGTFKAAYTHATVDEAIPTAGIAAIPKYVGSPSVFDAEVNTTLVQLGLTARPMPKLSMVANLRYHDVNDETPTYDLVGTNPAGPVTVHGTPLDYTTLTGKLEGTYSLPQGYSVIAGIDYSDQERTVPVGSTAIPDTERYVPFREELDEITYRIQLRKSLSETLNGSLAYLFSDRDGSNFAAGRNAAVDQIAPLHIADRERNRIRLTADWAPTEELGVQLNLETSKDEYGLSAARPHGVHEGETNVYSIDISYRLNQDWLVSAWYSHDTNEIYQTGRGPSGVGIKTASQDDTGNAVGLNLAGTINPRLKVGADVSWIREESSITQTWTGGLSRKCQMLPARLPASSCLVSMRSIKVLTCALI